MKKYLFSLELQLRSKFAIRIGIRAYKTFNDLLARNEKYIQFKENLAPNKVIYRGGYEKAKTTIKGNKEIKHGTKKIGEVKTSPNKPRRQNNTIINIERL